MKHFPFLLTILLCAGAVSSQAAPTVRALTKDVTVFLRGAEVRQEATFTLRQGENEVRVEGLAPDLDRQSLRIALSDQVVLTSYEFTTDQLTNESSARRLKMLEDSVQYYRQLSAQASSDLATTDEMLALLQTGLNTALTPAEQTLSTDQIEKNLTYFRTRQNQLKKERMRQEAELKAANEQAESYSRQLKEEQKQNKRRCGVVTLHLNAARAKSCTTVLTYYTNAASWTPFYDLHIQNPESPVTLMMKAHVRQTTGIDWAKAHLTLSTGQPARRHDAPKPEIWYLRAIEPQPIYKAQQSTSRRAYKAAMPMMMEDGVMAEEIEEDAMPVATASIENYVQASDQTLSREYRIALPYTIEGNGKEQTISLMEHKAEPKDTRYTYLCVPKTDGGTYLTLDISNWQSWGLLNGNVNITNNNVFYGQSHLNPSSTNGPLNLTIGEDKQIAVHRELMQDYSRTKTTGNITNTTRTYRITVSNNRTNAVTVRVQEPYPVSTDKSISVELTEETSPASSNNKERGLLTYELELSAGSTETLTVGYTVKYPKEKDINL